MKDMLMCFCSFLCLVDNYLWKKITHNFFETLSLHIRRSLHVHVISVYSNQNTPMYMQTLFLKHTARHTNAVRFNPDSNPD